MEYYVDSEEFPPPFFLSLGYRFSTFFQEKDCLEKNFQKRELFFIAHEKVFEPITQKSNVVIILYEI